MHGAKEKVPASFPPGPFFVCLIVTILRSPAAAGRPGYQDGRLPVAPAQQVRGGHGRRDLAAPAGGHTPTPVRWLRFAARRSSAACAPAAPALPGRRFGPRSALRSPRRDG